MQPGFQVLYCICKLQINGIARYYVSGEETSINLNTCMLVNRSIVASTCMSVPCLYSLGQHPPSGLTGLKYSATSGTQWLYRVCIFFYSGADPGYIGGGGGGGLPGGGTINLS